MAKPVKHLTRRYRLDVASRAAAGLLGGYLLAALSTVAIAHSLPLAKADAVLFGTMSGFLVFTGAGIWAFAARNTWSAWLGLLLPAIALAMAGALLGATA